jgi:hypothetical protein
MTQNIVTNDEAVTGSTKFKKGMFQISGGTFVENVQKSPKPTHPTVYCTISAHISPPTNSGYQ